jgi:hypothetical protein
MYSIDTRKAVLMTYNHFGSLRKTSEIHKISIATISRWLKRLEPIKRTYDNKEPLQVIKSFIFSQICTVKNTTCVDLQKSIFKIFNYKMSSKLINNFLIKANYTRKRIRRRTTSVKKTEKVIKFIKQIKNLPKSAHIVSIDESGFDARPRTVYGYSLKGERIVDTFTLLKNGKRQNLLLAISNKPSKYGPKHYYEINDKNKKVIKLLIRLLIVRNIIL